MIRVLICDDQDVVREGLRAILSTVPEIEVTGLASDAAEAVEAVEKRQPDVVLMDLNMTASKPLARSMKNSPASISWH